MNDSTLRQMVGGVLTGDDRSQAEEHLSRCRDCRDRLTRLLEGPVPVTESAPPELVRRALEVVPEPRRRPPARWLGLAAALLMVVALGIVFRPPSETPVPDGEVLREGQASSSATVLLESPPTGALAGAESVRFEWQPIPGVARYRFELLSETGDVLFAESGTGSWLEIPREQLEVESGWTGYWSVQATLGDGAVVQSPLRRIRF